ISPLRDIVAIICPLLGISCWPDQSYQTPTFTKHLPLFGSLFPWIALFLMVAWPVMSSRKRPSICPVGWWSRWPWTMATLPAPQLGGLIGGGFF
ncbi:hypothetical protein EDB19DRAFT_1714389, partial [Suillus lakei]